MGFKKHSWSKFRERAPVAPPLDPPLYNCHELDNQLHFANISPPHAWLSRDYTVRKGVTVVLISPRFYAVLTRPVARGQRATQSERLLTKSKTVPDDLDERSVVQMF